MKSDRHPERLGPYRILQVLGEGGMGVVYEAEQTEPIHRRVALKVMKVGMDTKEVVARFEAERQALAIMNHPGIAQVLDAGSSESGRPYFVMELVKGIPLTDYCDQRKLPLRDRITLFIAVCQAVQHAHQKGVIHRDIKPSNILIIEQEGRPAPKIIDFGIAKAIGQRLTQQTLVTAYGTTMGTLAYMSPEQAEMSTLDVDTRADIYSLGVVLYELLVGTLPADPKLIGYQKFMYQLMTREIDTPRPSTRVTTQESRDLVASLRDTDAGSLRRVLRGDLDWIVLRAMERDRNRRYDTANGLALDLARYLRNEPVSARPPTAWYRFGKFARRNRAAVLASVVVVASLVAGVVLATVGLVRATRAEAAARQDAETARSVSDFLVELFAVGDPSAARGEDVTAKALLDRGAERIRTELTDRPLVQARLMATMGAAYSGLGRFDRSIPLLEESVRRFGEAGSADAGDAASAKGDLAWALAQEGDLVRSERLGREALAQLRASHGDDRYHPDVAAAVRTLVAILRRERSDVAESEALLRPLVAQERALGLEDEGTARTMDLLCWTLLDKGDLIAAKDVCDASLARFRRLYHHDNIATAVALQREGVVDRVSGRYQDALTAYREALEMNRRLYGDGHLEMSWQHYDLSLTFRAMQRFDSATAHARESVRIRRASLPDDSPMLAEALEELSLDLQLRGDVTGSLKTYQEAMVVEERGRRHRGVLRLPDLTRALQMQARYGALQRRAGHQAPASGLERARFLLDSAAANGVIREDSPALDLNALCWWGSLSGAARQALTTCEAAVTRSDEGARPRIRDSRGLARAIAGDYPGAIEDFEAYVARPANVAGVPRREAWIELLKRGQNPFTHEELDRLILQ
jgi:tetratricopeptide (TPR) repeat protein/tRNA A-37 threonylcarbamoyl transferase component Bud32